ncbi:MAG TPA: polysaccharide biosynthesis tyrosine autokinase [Candidatus Limnocylindria bacterium]|jgi:capsular exopolysaccharide synthesis family protein|nr:polysaccharide biosynthesis tyrosine autokinase [Candidatus Limnocylindria bacterium]
MKYPYSSYNAALPGYGTSLVDRINIYLHFRKYLKIITDRWLLLLVTVVSGTALGCWVAFTKPYMYQAHSRVMVVDPPRLNQNSGVDLTGEGGAKFMDQQLQLLVSRDLFNKVSAKLSESSGGTNKLIAATPKPSLERSGTFLLNVVSTNLEYARLFSITWADEFLVLKAQQANIEKTTVEADAGRKLREFNRSLEKAQDSLREFRRKYLIVVTGDEGTRKQNDLERLLNKQTELETTLALYRAAKPEDLATGSVNPKGNPVNTPRRAQGTDGSDDAKSEYFSPGSRYVEQKLTLNRMIATRDQWTNTLRPSHPFMLQRASDIAMAEADIKSTLALIEEARLAQIRSLDSELARLNPVIETKRDEVSELTSMIQEYRTLQEDEKSSREQVREVSDQIAKFQQNSGGGPRFIISESGAAEDKPISPNKPYIIGCGVGGGMLVGIAIMYLLHRLDDRLESPESIEEALEEPIMGQLPEVDKRHYKEGYLLLSRMKSHTMFAESLRGVRSALLLSPEGSSKRFIAVTSAVPGDGKTTFTANFAITLANSGNRTLLVDADLRRGNIHGYFDQPLEGGLSEVLQGKLSFTEAVRETGIPNLFFMRAGERPQNPSELLLANTTRDLIRDLRAEFDYVIFDCPPLTAIDDTFSIAAYLDGLFFVIRAGRTSMRFAKMGINTIRQRGTPILGLIVNGVPIDNPYYYYTTYYYASYYHRPLKQDEPAAPDRRRIPTAKAPALPPGMQLPDQHSQHGDESGGNGNGGLHGMKPLGSTGMNGHGAKGNPADQGHGSIEPGVKKPGPPASGKDS